MKLFKKLPQYFETLQFPVIDKVIILYLDDVTIRIKKTTRQCDDYQVGSRANNFSFLALKMRLLGLYLGGDAVRP